MQKTSIFIDENTIFIDENTKNTYKASLDAPTTLTVEIQLYHSQYSHTISRWIYYSCTWEISTATYQNIKMPGWGLPTTLPQGREYVSICIEYRRTYSTVRGQLMKLKAKESPVGSLFWPDLAQKL